MPRGSGARSWCPHLVQLRKTVVRGGSEALRRDEEGPKHEGDRAYTSMRDDYLGFSFRSYRLDISVA